jgi:hypothetical protein
MESFRRRFIRRAERWLIGIAMGFLAFALERAVRLSINRESKATPPAQPRR